MRKWARRRLIRSVCGLLLNLYLADGDTEIMLTLDDITAKHISPSAGDDDVGELLLLLLISLIPRAVKLLAFNSDADLQNMFLKTFTFVTLYSQNQRSL